MNSLLQDVRFAIRVLRKNPGFVAMAILTLALGVGANTAIFSVVNAVLLRPLDFKSPANVYVLTMEDVKKHLSGGDFGYIFYQTLRERNTSFESMAAFTTDTFNLIGGDAPEQLQANRVSPSFFDVLGVQPALGRSFLKPEGEPGGPPVVVLGHQLWTRRFGSDPNLVGRSVTLDGISYTVVGILGRELDVPFQQVDVWVPRPYETSLFPAERVQTGSGYLNAIARLKPGVPVSQAKAELDASAHQYEHAYPSNSDASFDTTINVASLTENALGGVRTTLWVLLGAVGFVLLIVCANVANLFLARAAGRQKEIAVRSALGASRWRLVRQFLTESMILAVTGGAIGIFIAAWTVRLISTSSMLTMPRAGEISVDGAVLIFSFAVSLAAGILFGIVPAWRTSRANLSEIMNEASRGSSAGARRNRAGALIIIAELGFSVVLLAGAGLLLQSFYRLLHVSLGFEPQNILTFQIALPATKYPQPFQKADFHAQLRERIAVVPGVRSVATALLVPPDGGLFAPYLVEGMPPDLPRGQRPIALWGSISPAYFQVLGIPLLKGRNFSDADTEKSAQVVIISQSMATRYWPHEDPIGRHIQVARQPAPSEVVGVVGDVRNRGVGSDSTDELYTPLPQRPWGTMSVLVKTSGDPMQIVSAVRSALQSVDRDQPMTQVRSLEENLSSSIGQQRVSALLLGIFAALALVLAAIGIYGVTSYSVAQRSKEIGIRIAMGAQPRDVLRLILGFGAKLALIGVVIGIIAALALTQLMKTMLFGVAATDPLTMAAVSITLIAVTLLACYIPARRAMIVDPVVALRAE
jgi:putative ABC transport system permease protein